MEIKKGALIASAVAVLFIASCTKSPDDSAAQPAAMASGSQMAKIKCMGANDCKGKGACQGAGHDCTGKNDFKGKGYVNTDTKEECTSKGGRPEA
jgi:hypothetical protein